MKRINTITVAGFAVCGVLLGMKALDLVEAGITLLLMVWGGYAYGAAAARAPLILWAVLATAAGLALSLYELHRENQQYQRMQQRHKMRADNAYYQFQSEMWQAMSDDYAIMVEDLQQALENAEDVHNGN